MSLVPERWEAIGKGTDPESGLPMVFVAREKTDFERRLTVWKLVKRPNAWYSVGQWISQGRWRRFPETNGVRLSDSRIDQILRSYANEAA